MFDCAMWSSQEQCRAPQASADVVLLIAADHYTIRLLPLLLHCRWTVWPGQPHHTSSRLWHSILWVAVCIHGYACSLWWRCSKQLPQPQHQQGQERQEAMSRSGIVDCTAYVACAALHHDCWWQSCTSWIFCTNTIVSAGCCYSICMGSTHASCMWLAADEQ